MSVRVFTVVRCDGDGCDAMAKEATVEAEMSKRVEAIEKANRLGWIRVKNSSGEVDLCPDCRTSY